MEQQTEARRIGRKFVWPLLVLSITYILYQLYGRTALEERAVAHRARTSKPATWSDTFIVHPGEEIDLPIVGGERVSCQLPGVKSSDLTGTIHYRVNGRRDLPALTETPTSEPNLKDYRREHGLTFLESLQLFVEAHEPAVSITVLLYCR